MISTERKSCIVIVSIW